MFGKSHSHYALANHGLVHSWSSGTPMEICFQPDSRLLHLKERCSNSRVQVFNDVNTSWRTVSTCLAAFLLNSYISDPHNSVRRWVHPPPRVPIDGTVVGAAFENWNAKCHQETKRMTWKEMECIVEGFCCAPILDIHVAVNTLAVAVLSSAWRLSSPQFHIYNTQWLRTGPGCSCLRPKLFCFTLWWTEIFSVCFSYLCITSAVVEFSTWIQYAG
jgi:hypothetical protein